MDVVVQPEPDGWGGGWLSLDVDRQCCPISAIFLYLVGGGSDSSHQWFHLLQKNRRYLCGCDLMGDIAIRVENLGKKYKIGANQTRYQTLRESIVNGFSNSIERIKGSQPKDDNIIWALKDINFEVKHGEVLGIIGRNGAGKSTLLKILARITRPTTGRFELIGRVGSLLEVGTGFHPELTGRDNISLSGAILGMQRKEINRKFDEIVDFAEIEKFLDTPVKHYSSGMYMRLAFSVAAHLEPEILLVDEVLAVGDAEFQKKCLGKMGDVAGRGRTVLFVSHNMGAIENLCSKSIVINEGKIKKSSSSREAINYYLEKITDQKNNSFDLKNNKNRSGSGDIRLTGFHVENNHRELVSFITSGDNLTFVFNYETKNSKILRNIDIGFSIHSISSNQTLCVFYSSYVGTHFTDIPNKGSFCCNVSKFPFAPGRYRVGARLVVNNIESDWPQDGVGYLDVEIGNFYKTGSQGFPGNVPILLKGDWKVTNHFET